MTLFESMSILFPAVKFPPPPPPPVELMVVTPLVVDKVMFVPADRFGLMSPVIWFSTVIEPDISLKNSIFRNALFAVVLL